MAALVLVMSFHSKLKRLLTNSFSFYFITIGSQKTTLISLNNVHCQFEMCILFLGEKSFVCSSHSILLDPKLVPQPKQRFKQNRFFFSNE